MKLILKRPLAFFDLETTGTNLGTDRILEIAVIKLHPDDSEEVKTWRVNPGMPIPLESSLVHGIYDEHIANEPAFEALAQDIADFIGKSDLAGYNSNKFDIPMLMEEFLRAKVEFDLENRHFVDVQNIFHQMEQRTLKAAYQFYCSKDIINAHSAEADTRATMEVLLAQVARYHGTEWEDKKGIRSVPVVGDVEALHKFTNLSKPVDFAGRLVYNEDGEEVINFGKHKGKRVEDVFDAEPSYYSWMMQGDFPLYTKRKLEEIYKRWSAKKAIERQNRPQQPKPQQPAQQNFVKKDYQKPQYQNNRPNNNYSKKDDTPAKPVNDDMLKLLADKFKKG
ncbi:DNA polymerase III subunit epsilon [Mucilaginibacter roseus]|uniref:DNA polymerase III subunit epsilon n=1 Tax=Mucilaginibacter roseus TaxID=1528868 RepID=A0ABS8U244_9SPHI|nr:3'-5' exonuclease [Mucilaginibacter roseus]MCD8739964.1 DNA polymerase III subunit epsilon [Mucilaginibacter roseus]